MALSQSTHAKGEGEGVSSQIGSRSHSLQELLLGMKPSFLVKEGTDTYMRQVFLSGTEGYDPLVLLRQGGATVLIGSGFGMEETQCGNFQTLPDLRLPFSERSKLQGWILLSPNIDWNLALLMLEVLEFPPIFAPRDVIAKFRESIHHPAILHRCRFFEIFSDVSSQCIGGMNFTIAKNGDNNILALQSEKSLIGYDWIRIHQYPPVTTVNILITKDGNKWKV